MKLSLSLWSVDLNTVSMVLMELCHTQEQDSCSNSRDNINISSNTSDGCVYLLNKFDGNVNDTPDIIIETIMVLTLMPIIGPHPLLKILMLMTKMTDALTSWIAWTVVAILVLSLVLLILQLSIQR